MSVNCPRKHYCWPQSDSSTDFFAVVSSTSGLIIRPRYLDQHEIQRACRDNGQRHMSQHMELFQSICFQRKFMWVHWNTCCRKSIASFQWSQRQWPFSSWHASSHHLRWGKGMLNSRSKGVSSLLQELRVSNKYWKEISRENLSLPGLFY